MQPLLESFDALKREFAGEPALVRMIDQEISSLNEWIAAIFNLRAKNLALGIHQLLDGQPKTADKKGEEEWLIDEFYNHPLVAGMMKVVWMVLLSVVIFAEKVLLHGTQTSTVVGLASTLWERSLLPVSSSRSLLNKSRRHP